MKKALVLLLGFTIIFYSAGAIAETTIKKPGVPADYETWDKVEEKCQIKTGEPFLTYSFIRVITGGATKKIESVETIKIGKEVIVLVHAQGVPYEEPDFAYGYVLVSGHWKQFDLTKFEDSVEMGAVAEFVINSINPSYDVVYNTVIGVCVAERIKKTKELIDNLVIQDRS